MTRKATPPSRLFLYACGLTPFISLPCISILYGVDIPLSGSFMLPVWVIDSFAMIIHELGHAAAKWMFGEP